MSKPASAAIVKTIPIDWSALPSAASVAVHPPKFPPFDGQSRAAQERPELAEEGPAHDP